MDVLAGPDGSTLELADFALEQGSIDAVEDLLPARVSGVRILTGGDDVAVLEVAQWCAQASTSSVADVLVALPDGARWTSDEVRSRVVSPAVLRAQDVTQLVVGACDTLSARDWDRLLKVVEEPEARVVFWLCCGQGDIPATVRGRAVGSAVLRGGGTHAVHQVLLGEGWQDAPARRAADLAGGDIRLARLYADLPDVVEAFATKGPEPHRAGRAAEEMVAAASMLAAGMAGRRASGWSDLDVTGRQFARSVLRRWVARWVLSAARGCAGTWSADQAARCLELESRWVDALTLGLPVAPVTTALLAAWPEQVRV